MKVLVLTVPYREAPYDKFIILMLLFACRNSNNVVGISSQLKRRHRVER